MATATAEKLDVLARFNMSSDDPRLVTECLQEAAKNYHLISPATSVAIVPEGCNIALVAVLVDVEHETFPARGGGGGDEGRSAPKGTPGELRSLSKTAIDRIAGAAGITWDEIRSCRVDNGSDPLYCQWRAVGSYLAFDGTPIRIPKNKTIDLRKGSPQLNGKTPARIDQEKNFIQEQAESKAMNRVVRNLGLRSSYTVAELQKPFIVARLMLSGRSSDPALARELTLMRAHAMLSGGQMLFGGGGYGASASAPQQLGSGAPARELPALSAPPPVGSTPEDDEEDGGAEGPTPGYPVVAFGTNKGKSIDQLSDSDLAWYAGACQKSIDDPTKAKYKASNQRVLDACRAVQRARTEKPETPPSDSGEREPGDDFPT